MLCVRIPEQTKQALNKLVEQASKSSKYKITLSQVVSNIIEEHLKSQSLPLQQQHNK